MKHKKVLVFLIVVGALGFGVHYIYQQINDTINYLQQHIEKDALPILRRSVPLLDGELLSIVPGAQGLLDRVGFGIFNVGKITKSITRETSKIVTQPLVESALESTRRDLNKELKYVQITSMTYENVRGQKTITAKCSYDIKVILTGRTFRRIINRQRNHLTLTFTCD